MKANESHFTFICFLLFAFFYLRRIPALVVSGASGRPAATKTTAPIGPRSGGDGG
jgi:hypothetical protein